MTPHPSASRPLSLVLSCLLLAACASGGDGNGPVPSFAVAVRSPTAATTLGTTTSFTVDVTSSRFAGPVTLSVSGAPASWAVQVSPAAVELADGGSATATVTITVPTNGESAQAREITIEGRAPSGSHTATATLTVANEYVRRIPAGTGSGQHWVALMPPLPLRPGTTLTIRNDDGTPHRIHADGDIPGFPHQEMSMTNGQSYSVVVGAGAGTIYCHDHGTLSGLLDVRVE